MKKWGKLLMVICGAVTVTALGIDAADTLTGSRNTMLAQLIPAAGACPAGMIEVAAATSFSCVDRFEASPADGCAEENPGNEFDTRNNLNDERCAAQSKKDATPWRYITREQAQLACARSQKRLPSAAEWYQFALGTTDTKENCNINSGGVVTNKDASLCRSAVGAINTIGNVWEWVSDDVIDGSYNGRKLPAEGYVEQVDQGGVAVVTNYDPVSEQFNQDYFWSKPNGAFGILRGGFYGSQSDAGVYSVLAHQAPTFQGEAIGFRCVQ